MLGPLESKNRPSSEEESSGTLDDSSGNLLEEAFDYFTCMEIGKSIEKEAAKNGKLDEEILSNEIIAQFSKIQAPKSKVKFGDTQVTHFHEDEKVSSSKNANFPISRLITPPSILKPKQGELGSDSVEEIGSKLGHQEKLLKVFHRCYSLCGIPTDQFDENNPFKSLKTLCDGIKKAFKAKDECYKYVRHEENKNHSQEIERLKGVIQDLANEKHDPLASMQINRFQELMDEYRDEIKELTAQVTSANYEMSELRSKNSELQNVKETLAEKLERTLSNLKQLENCHKENVELTKETAVLNNNFEELNKEHRSLQEQHTRVSKSNSELNTMVNSLETTVNKWTSDHRELKLDRDNLESLNKNLNERILQESKRMRELETNFTQVQQDSRAFKTEFKNRIQELISENINTTSQANNSKSILEDLQSKYDQLTSEQREAVKQKERFQRESDQEFAKNVELQLQLEQHAKFKEQAVKFNAEREACLMTLKKLDFDYHHLQKSFEHLYTHNTELVDFQKAAKRTIEEMDLKIIRLEQAKVSDAFKIDTLTRQVLKQTDTIDRLQLQLKSSKKCFQKNSEKRDILRSLANTKTLLRDPLTLSKNMS